MPKEAKEPLFCCGAHHKSANYHKRTVHQQHTKIYWRAHPQAGFILRRNPVTSLFHCPKCDKSWAMATPVRNHIFRKCAGYAQYRSAAAAKGDDKIASDTSDLEGNSADDSEVITADLPAPSLTQKTESDLLASNAVDGQDGILPLSTSCGSTSKTKASDHKVETARRSSGKPASPGAGMERTTTFPPTLRPAVWSPVVASRSRCPPPSLPPSAESSDLSRSLPSPRSISACSSMSSGRTLAGAPSVSRTIAVRFKTDPDDALSVSAGVSRGSLAQSGPFESPSLFPPRSPERPTAVRAFLDGLRRALGHAAPLFYKMGLATEEDLTLICTMPEAWDEIGTVLQIGGLTTLEWLMVKEAFKAKARSLAV